MTTNTVKTSYKVDFLVDNGFTSKIERIEAVNLNNAITIAKKAMENPKTTFCTVTVETVKQSAVDYIINKVVYGVGYRGFIHGYNGCLKVNRKYTYFGKQYQYTRKEYEIVYNETRHYF